MTGSSLHSWSSGSGFSYDGRTIVSRWGHYMGDGLYFVVLATGGMSMTAVVDDFGNLVRVWGQA